MSGDSRGMPHQGCQGLGFLLITDLHSVEHVW